MWLYFVLLGLITAIIYKLFFSNNDKNFWKQYGIRQIDASCAASNYEVFQGKKDITVRDEYVYDQMGNEKFCGMIESSNKFLLVKDLELLKKVFIKDFEHFVDRRQFFSAAREDSILRRMVAFLAGDEWKEVRTILSPAFTTGKIRRLMTFFNTIGKDWVAELKSQANANNGSLTVDVVTCVNQYAVDVIAAGVFGIDAGTIKNPQSIFATMGNRLNNFNVTKLTLSLYFPSVFRFLGIDLVDMEAMNFFENIVKQGMQSRMSGQVKKNDFLQLMLEARSGQLKQDANDELDSFEKDAQLSSAKVSKHTLSDDMINAQSVAFFFAGLSTINNFITFCLYALATHPDVQTKLREEVDKIVGKDGDLDYDQVSQLTYMDMVSCEILRLYPGALRLERKCVKEYTDAETGMHVPKGAYVSIPVKSMHYDKKYYEKPDQFYPEHFSPEKKAERSPYVYLPFGLGPRNCIGMRFALVESKVAIAHLIHGFILQPSEKTPVPMNAVAGGMQYLPPKGLELKLVPRK